MKPSEMNFTQMYFIDRDFYDNIKCKIVPSTGNGHSVNIIFCKKGQKCEKIGSNRFSDAKNSTSALGYNT